MRLVPKRAATPLPPGFYFVLASQGISLIGSDMQQIAMPLWLYDKTGSVLSAGISFAVQFVPIVLVAPWAGYIADRFDRRRLMLASELTAAVVVAFTLTSLHFSIVPLVVACSALTRIFNSFTMPAMQAVIINLVPEDDRARSASLSTILIAGVAIIAPLAGTAVEGALGFQAVLIMDLVSFLLSAVLLVGLPSVPGVANLRNPARATWFAFRDHASRLLRSVVFVESVYFLLWGADSALALLILKDQFGPASAGTFATSLGAGWLLGSTLIPARFKRRTVMMITAGSACCLVGAVAFVLLVRFGLVAAFLPGVLDGIGNLALVLGATTVFQREAGTDVAGRLFAARRAILNLALAVSYILLPGVSAAGLGNKATMVLFAGLMFVAVQLMAGLLLRRADNAQQRTRATAEVGA
jgi:MFS transporter, DHA3 family, macrolide efflux protein